MTDYLNNELIYKSFILGAKNVIQEKNGLNAINVFPVPDGDTGSNLASMMQSIIERSKLGKTSEETLQSIADAAIVGARGNSGIIFAQYIYGFSLEVQNEVNKETFTDMLKRAFNYAYQSIAKPVEGTMITVMRAFAHAVDSFKEKGNDFLDILSNAYEAVKIELARTPELLAVLKENKVVDAGAKGFVHFIEGFIKALKGEEIDMTEHESIEHIHVEHLEDSQFRYCTEALLRGSNFDLNNIRQSLAKDGDSLVVAGSDKTVRIHIHSDHPDQVFEKLSKLGTISEQKVDDMRRQFEAANHPKYKIALVTDSIADLPVSFVDEHQIHQFPLNLHMEDTIYYDKLTIQSDRFYQMMDELSVYPTSSQPNQKTLENFFSFLTTYYDEIIVITVSEEMSGTYRAFVDAANKFSNKKIRVINSKQNSGAEGLLVMKAQELIQQGLPIDEIVKKMDYYIKHSKIFVSVRTLKYMVKNGRVSKVTGVIGKITNLKPVISIDENGKGIISDKGLSLKSSDKKIYNRVKEAFDRSGIEKYAIVHANGGKRVYEYVNKYTKLIGRAPDYVMDISTIVAMNAGLGTIAISYIEGDKS
jgi:hypothetical protein